MSHPVGDSGRMEKLPVYQPTAHYYRQQIRTAKTKADVAAVAFALVIEIERHKEWIRAQGLIPPRWLVMQNDPRSQAVLLAFPSPSTKPASETAE